MPVVMSNLQLSDTDFELIQTKIEITNARIILREGGNAETLRDKFSSHALARIAYHFLKSKDDKIKGIETNFDEFEIIEP